MAKKAWPDPCSLSPRCCLVDSHDGSCMNWKVEQVPEGWDLLLFDGDGEVAHRLELTEEPDEQAVRAAAAFMEARGSKMPGARFMAALPELRETIYGPEESE